MPAAPISRKRPGWMPKVETRSGPKSLARISKLATGWSAHLFYWAYSGVMAAMMATMIGYIYNQFTGHDLSSGQFGHHRAWSSPS